MPENIMDAWILPKPEHILACIEHWRGLDFKRMTESEVDSELRSLLNLLECISISKQHKRYPKLWRIRRYKELHKDIAEFWEPPAKSTPLNRCNAKGVPVLYVCEKLRTPFEELAIKAGEQFYLIEYKSKDSLNLFNVCPKELFPTDLDNNELYQGSYKISYQILRDFVRTEFLKPVGEGTEYLYRVSDAMCRIWFEEKNMDGWAYPSVQLGDDLNIAIKPEVAHNKLEIAAIRVARMFTKEDALTSLRQSNYSLKPYKPMQLFLKTDFVGRIEDTQICWFPSEEITAHYPGLKSIA